MALVANELLAFIQHAIDTMDEVSIMQICKSSFSSEEICKSKQLLYETLGQSANMPSRRRDGTERSVQDIISLLKQTDPDEVPAFELHKLPPVTLDHVDVVSLLKDIRFLKEELAGFRGRLQASESTISELRIELLQLKSGASICRSPDADAAFVTSRRGAQASTFSPSALSSDGSTNTAAAAPAPAPLPVAPTLSPQATQKNFATVAGRPAPPPRAKTNGANESRKASKSRETESRKATKSRKVESSRLGKDEGRRCDEEGFILVERRKKPAARNHRGTAPYVPELRLRSEVPATPLYISRLHWSMEVQDVVDYIQKKTTLRLRVERLQSRHKVNFSSFVVRVPTNLLSTFEAPEFWPMDVVYRRFRGRLRNEASHVAGKM